MTAKLRERMALSMFLVNAVAAVAAPMVIFAGLGVARATTISSYRDLEAKGVIVTNAEKAKSYPNAELGGDWGDVAIYLTNGFRDLSAPAYGVAILFGANAILFFLIWTGSRDIEVGKPVEAGGAIVEGCSARR